MQTSALCGLPRHRASTVATIKTRRSKAHRGGSASRCGRPRGIKPHGGASRERGQLRTRRRHACAGGLWVAFLRRDTSEPPTRTGLLRTKGGAIATAMDSTRKRAAGSAEASDTPAAKRREALVPTSAGGDEVERLQVQAHTLRSRCDELQAEAQAEAKKAALELLRERQKREEAELHVDFLSRAESRLKDQLADARKEIDEERTARLQDRHAANERLETACDELRATAASARAADQQTIRELQSEAAAKATSGGGGEKPAAAAELAVARRAEAEARAAVAEVEAQLGLLRGQLQVRHARLSAGFSCGMAGNACSCFHGSCGVCVCVCVSVCVAGSGAKSGRE